MKLIFAGTPPVALPSLAALTGGEHEVAAVITRADAPLGRKRLLTPSAVAAAAEARGLPVIKTNRLDDEATARIRSLGPDLGVIVAYGGLVREPLLSVPRLGWINLHFSLLPRWRGASPVQRAVIAGDEQIGAAVFQLVPELDAGAVFGTFAEPLGADLTAGDLLESLSHSGAALLRQVVDGLAAGTLAATEQHGEVTLAPKLRIEDARIDWTLPAGAVYNRVRGVTPEPGAFTTIEGARLKILQMAPGPGEPPLAPGQIRGIDKTVLVGTGTGPLELRTVQPAGKTAMTAIDWWRGISARGATDVVAS